MNCRNVTLAGGLAITLALAGTGVAGTEQGTRAPAPHGGTVSPASAEAEVQALEMKRTEAILKHDVPTLEQLVAEDYVHVDNAGVVRDRAGWLALYREGRRTVEVREHEQLRVRVFGDVAVVNGTLRSRIHGEGAHEGRVHFTDIWHKQPDGRWQIVSAQYTRAPDARVGRAGTR